LQRWRRPQADYRAVLSAIQFRPIDEHLAEIKDLVVGRCDR